MDRLFREQNMITLLSTVARGGAEPETMARLYESGIDIVEIAARFRLRKNTVIDILRIFMKAKRLKDIRRTDPVNDPSRKKLYYKVYEAESDNFIGMAEKEEIQLGKQFLFTTDLYNYYITPKSIEGTNVFVVINKYNTLENLPDNEGSPFI